MAQQIGYLVWMIFMPLFFLLLIGCIQFIRTHDINQARQAAISRWAIGVSVGLWLLALFARLTQNFY